MADTPSRAQTIARKVLLRHPVRENTVYNTVQHHSDSHKHVEHEHVTAGRKYESIAFEEPDGPGLRKHYRGQSRASRIVQEVLAYVLACAITFAISWLYIGLFFGTEKLAEKRIEHFAELVEEGHTGQAVIYALWTCLVAALLPAALIVVWAPGVIGSGLVELIAFLNGANSITQSTVLNMFARYIGIFGLGVAGLYSGIDGPMAMIGASLAILVVLRIRRMPVFRRYFYGESLRVDDNDLAAKAGRNALFSFLEQKALRLFATLGAAVAISAIFRSPLGGVMFTLEETMSFFEPHVMIRTLFCTVIAFLAVGYEVAKHMHAWDDFQVGLSSGNLEMTLFPTNVQCHRVTPLRPSDLAISLASYALLGLVMAFVGTIWNRLLSTVQALRQPYTMRSLDKPVSHASSDEHGETGSATAAASTGKKSPKTRRILFSTIRLAEVAVVGIITTLIVVLLPTASSVDPCVPLTRAVNHVRDATPPICLEGVEVNATTISDRKLQACLEQFGGVCLPPDLKASYEQSIIRNFYRKVEELAAGNNRTVDRVSGGGSSGSDGGSSHLRTEAVTGDVPSRDIPFFNADASKFLPFRSSLPPSLRTSRARLTKRQDIGSDDAGHGTTTPTPATSATPANSEAHEAGTISEETSHDELEALIPKTDLHAQHMKVNSEEECYYQVKSLLWTTPERQLKLILTRGFYELFDMRTLGIFLGLYMFLSLITYYIALPTDLVIPNLIMGAIAGRISGIVWNMMTTEDVLVDPGLFSLIGMAGMWSATSRLTLTVIVICLELTGDFDAIPALIVVCFTAAWMSSFLGESLYHLEMHQNATPYLPAEPSHHLRTITIRKIMSHHDMVVVTSTARLSACAEAVESGHNGFPVCEKLSVEDSTGRTVVRYRPVGFVYRDLLSETLSSLLHKEQYDPTTTRIDMTALMNVSPTIVREDATAAKVFGMIRTMGLRHVMIVDKDGFLVGIVTRNDLLRGMHDGHGGIKGRRTLRKGMTMYDGQGHGSGKWLVVGRGGGEEETSAVITPFGGEKKEGDELGEHRVRREAADTTMVDLSQGIPQQQQQQPLGASPHLQQWTTSMGRVRFRQTHEATPPLRLDSLEDESDDDEEEGGDSVVFDGEERRW